MGKEEIRESFPNASVKDRTRLDLRWRKPLSDYLGKEDGEESEIAQRLKRFKSFQQLQNFLTEQDKPREGEEGNRKVTVSSSKEIILKPWDGKALGFQEWANSVTSILGGRMNKDINDGTLEWSNDHKTQVFYALQGVIGASGNGATRFIIEEETMKDGIKVWRKLKNYFEGTTRIQEIISKESLKLENWRIWKYL